jgi:hypothetical protein
MWTGEVELSEGSSDWSDLDRCLKDLSGQGAHGALYLFAGEKFNPRLVEAVKRLAAAGRFEPVVVAEAGALRSAEHLHALGAAGGRRLFTTMYGASAESNDGRARREGAWKETLALLGLASRGLAAARDGQQPRLGVHVALTRETAAEIPRIVQGVARLGVREVLVWDATTPAEALDGEAAVRAIDEAWRVASREDIYLRAEGFDRTRHVRLKSVAPPPLCDATLLDFTRQGLPVPSARAGVRVGGASAKRLARLAPNGEALRAVGLELAARGVPMLDVPPCLGGAPLEYAPQRAPGIKASACGECPINDRCAGAPAALDGLPGLRDVLAPLPFWIPAPKNPRVLIALAGGDLGTLLVERDSTLPGLARILARQGAQVDLVSPEPGHFESPNFFREPSPPGLSCHVSAEGLEPFLKRTEYDLVIAPDLMIGLAVQGSRSLSPRTRLILQDFHMLGGMAGWVRDYVQPSRRPMEGNWWPSKQAVLWSCFPGYVHLYMNYGLPLHQVVWHPYTFHDQQYVRGPPVQDSDYILSGGNNLRDLETLLRAGHLLNPRTHPIHLYSSEPGIPVNPRVLHQGVLTLMEFYGAISRSRFLVAPLREIVDEAAGITVMGWALMSGRPVIASSTAAARDFIADGVNGILVPPGDAAALAAAIERVDGDPALLTDLAAGAREVASKMTAEHWARELLEGSRSYSRDHWMWMKLPRGKVAPA